MKRLSPPTPGADGVWGPFLGAGLPLHPTETVLGAPAVGCGFVLGLCKGFAAV